MNQVIKEKYINADKLYSVVSMLMTDTVKKDTLAKNILEQVLFDIKSMAESSESGDNVTKLFCSKYEGDDWDGSLTFSEKPSTVITDLYRSKFKYMKPFVDDEER